MKKYLAFISYRHSEHDKVVASGLHRRLELFHMPAGSAYSKKRKLFRDEEELPTGNDLGTDIDAALSESEYLIVICSPIFPKSKWCLREVEKFIESGRKDRILPVLISGDEESSIPEIIRDVPLAADLRGKKKTDDIVPHLLSIMTGISEEDIEKKEFRHRLSVTMAVMLTVAAALTGFSIYSAGVTKRIEQNNLDIKEATNEAERAEKRALEERNNAILSRADTLSDESKKLIEAGDYDGAIRNILPVLPSDDNPDIPYKEGTMAVLRTAMAIPQTQYAYARSLYPETEDDRETYDACIKLVTDALAVDEDELLPTLGNVRSADRRDLRLGVVREDGTLEVYSLSSGKKLASSGRKKYRHVYYPFETRRLYAVTEEGTVELLDGDSLELIREIHCSTKAKSLFACINKNYLLITCEKSVEVYRHDNGNRVFSAPTEKEPQSAIFNNYWDSYSTSDGEIFYVIYDDHVDLFRTEMKVDPASSDFVPFIDESYYHSVEWHDCLPDGKTMIIQSNVGDLYWWDTETGRLKLRLHNGDFGFSETGYDTSLSADGKYIWQPNQNVYSKLRKIDAVTGEVLFEIENKANSSIYEVPGGKAAVIQGRYGNARYVSAINSDTGELYWSLDGGDRKRFRNITMSEDGEEIFFLEEYMKEYGEVAFISYVVMDTESGKEKLRRKVMDIPEDVGFLSISSVADKVDILLRHESDDSPYDENLLFDIRTGEITGKVILPYKTGSLNEGNGCIYASIWETDVYGRIIKYYYQIVGEDGTVGEPIEYEPDEFVKDMVSPDRIMSIGGHRAVSVGKTIFDYDTGEPILFREGFSLSPCGGSDGFFIFEHKNYSGMLYPSDDSSLIKKAYRRLEGGNDK